MRSLLVLSLVLAAPAAFAQRGVPQNGFPSWQERTVQVLVNRTRADPTIDPKACTGSTALKPLMWLYPINRSARFQSTNMQSSGQFMHNSPCVLASNLGSTYLPGTTCSGAVSCACSTGAVTCTAAQSSAGTCPAGSWNTAFERMALFSLPSWNSLAENIAYSSGYVMSPTQVHNGWMNSSGHCANVLGNFTHLGVGFYGTASTAHWTQNFLGQNGVNPAGTLVSGSHDPQFSGGTVAFRVNYWHASAGPQEAKINIDGTCSTMTLERGTQANGTWLHSQALSGTSCRRYVFTFKDPGGATVTLPETGSYGVGGSVASCPDWSATAPTACPSGGGNLPPTIAAAATATPSPVTATTTLLTVLGADDGGEAALTYTWAATGPAAVSYSANGTNAAKSTTATFTRAGSYTFTVTLRDAEGLTVTSSVTVTVQQVPSSVSVSPPSASVPVLGTQAFTALVTDQFSQPIASPAVTWTVTGGGSISAAGVFTAGGVAGGPYVVEATSGAASGLGAVTVTNTAPTIATAAAATPSPVTGTTTAVTALGADDGGEAALLYTWTATGPAVVFFAPNGTNAAKASTASFTRVGTYSLTVTVRDAQGQSATSSVTVTVQATATTLTVSPSSANLAPGGTQAFTAAVTDQFGQPMTASPTWSVSGGGSISSGGVFTAGATPGGPHTVTATLGALTANAQVSVTAGSAPTLATAAAATPSPVTATTTVLSALGADDGGEAALTYTWSATGPAAVTYSVNGTNAAKSATATFLRAGSYVFTVTVRDAQGLTVTGSVTVVVSATPTTVAVSPATATLIPGATQPFSALVSDQFAQPLATQPAVTWTSSGGGSISSSGLFTAGAMAGGPHTITATAGGVSGTAQVTIGAGVPPTIATAASATPNPVTGTTTALSAYGADDQGEPSLGYTWSATGPAAVAFSVNGSNAAKNATATFTKAGTYVLTVMVSDAGGLTATSQVTVVVEATPTMLAVAPASATVAPGQTATFTASATDQFGDAMSATAQWSVSGGGTIDAAGVFTAGATSGGPHTVTATAGTLTATAQVTVSATPPPALQVQLTQPDAGAQVWGVVTLAATTSDDARVTNMVFLVDGVALATDAAAPWTTEWNTALVTEGTHRLAARATEGTGATTTSAEVTVTVSYSAPTDTTPPVVTLDSPSGTVTGDARLRATASDDVGVVEVVFVLDGAEVARLSAAPWAHDVPASALTAGTHEVTVTARDAAGNQASDTGSFTVPAPPPDVDPQEEVTGGCGCSGADVFALAALGALLLRRRRWGGAGVR